jgi:hypothetical protein
MIYEQVEAIHQKISEIVAKAYPKYRVLSVRDNSSTFYAKETTSIVEFHVEGVNGDKELSCMVEVGSDENVSITGAKERKKSKFAS